MIDDLDFLDGEEEDVRIGSVPAAEQETTISYSRSDSKVVIWSSDKTVWTKLDKLVEKSSHYRLKKTGTVKGAVVSKTYEIDDKSLISFRSDKVKLTEKQKAKRAEYFNRRFSFNSSHSHGENKH